MIVAALDARAMEIVSTAYGKDSQSIGKRVA